MCGITGILSFNQAPERSELERFTCSLQHRGPDSWAVYLDERIGLGHTRLAILDLSPAGACPMRYVARDGTEYYITFNGEIYNFIELRRELEAVGCRFNSSSDTEVIAAAYEVWGEECQFRFNGMWAFALWNTRTKDLFISRDRFGVKPLYYSVGSRLCFASELKAFLALSNFSPRLNHDVVPELIGNPISFEGRFHETILAGVRRLPGGHNIRVTGDGRADVKKWWDTAAHLRAVPDRYEDQVLEFKNIFLDAVRLRMRADVPIGNSLSGGVDSSSVACMMHYAERNGLLGERCSPNWHKTVIATFPGSPIDERPWAQQVVDHVGAQAIFWEFDPDKAMSHIVNSVWSMEEVYNGITVPQWCVYREMRRNGVVVSLDGHGGDELLGGYPWHLSWSLQSVNANIYTDFHFEILPSILRNYDRCSAAHGIEVRMPLMDYRLVTFAFSLPPESKIGAGQTKRILRDAVSGIVPEPVRVRKQKIGFNSPMVEWFNAGLGGMAEKIFAMEFWNDNPYFNGREIAARLRPRIASKSFTNNDFQSLLNDWVPMNLTLWHMLFVERRRTV